MANTFQKANQFAAASLGLLQREIIIPRLVWRNAGGTQYGAGDTISIRIPARTQARTRVLRASRPTASEGEGIITMDDLTETKIDVTLDVDIYNAVPTTDEEETLDIQSYSQQILQPQVRAVAEGLENKLAAEMMDASYPTSHTLTLDLVEPYDTFVDARVALNKANVPMSERYAVVGADFEGVLLKSDHLNRVDQSGTDSALRDATIGRLAGFNAVVVSNALPSNVGFLFHRSAYVLATVAPRVPDGASFGAVRTANDMSLRWIKDYDFRNVQDRSMVNMFAGTGIVNDGPGNEEQTATITGIPTGGTFTLTFSGQTTAAIAYNATAAAVKAALVALSNIGASDVSVTGSAGGPYTITFTGQYEDENVAALTASAAGLTGGTTPGVTIATTGDGGIADTFVRAVKVTM